MHVTAFVCIQTLASNLGPTKLSSSQPPILSTTALEQENSAFVWMPLSSKRLPDLSQDIFPAEFGSFTQFGICRYSSRLFVKQDSLFFPFRRTHREKSVRLSSDYWLQEQVPEHHPIGSVRAAEALSHRGSPTTIRGQHRLHDRNTDHPSFHFITEAHQVEILRRKLCPADDPETTMPTSTRNRAGSKTQKARSGKGTDNTSCETRVTKSRMHSTTSLGAVFLRNKETPVTHPHHEDILLSDFFRTKTTFHDSW